MEASESGQVDHDSAEAKQSLATENGVAPASSKAGGLALVDGSGDDGWLTAGQGQPRAAQKRKASSKKLEADEQSSAKEQAATASRKKSFKKSQVDEAGDAALAAMLAEPKVGGKKRNVAPVKLYTDTDNVQKKPKKDPAIKKRITDLAKKEEDLVKTLKELKAKELGFAKQVSKIRYPVPDEQIELVDKAGKRPTPLPKGHALFSNLTKGEDESDTIMLWDFFNTYGSLLELHGMRIEEFREMLCYDKKPTIMLVEVFCAPLRVILAEKKMAMRICRNLPQKVNFARKLTPAEVLEGAASAAAVGAFGDEELLMSNHLRLLPDRLRVEAVDGQRFHSVLQAALLRLPLVTRLLKAEEDVRAALALPPVGVRVASAFTGNSRRNLEKKKEQARADMNTPVNLTETIFRTVQDKAFQKKNGLNLDAILGVTDSCENLFLAHLKAASTTLKTTELWALPTTLKVAMLRALCMTCFETKVFRDHIDKNAREMADKLAEKRRAQAEKKQLVRAGKKSLMERAVQMCREENAAKASEKAAKAAEKAAKAAEKAAKAAAKAVASGGGGDAFAATAASEAAPPAKESKGKKSDPPAAAASASAAAAKKGKGKDELAPTKDQLEKKLDELVVMEETGVGEIFADIDDLVLMLVDRDKETDSEDGGGGGKSNAEQRKRDAKADKRLKEGQYRRDQMELALALLKEVNDADCTEKELRSAIKSAEKAELLYEAENDKMACHEELFRAYKKRHEMEEKAEEARLMSEFERAMAQFSIRTEPLGRDRDRNEYFQFGADDRLFVCKKDGNSLGGIFNRAGSVWKGTALEDVFGSPVAGALPQPVWERLRAQGQVDEKYAATGHLWDTRPSLSSYSWEWYTARELWELCEALDERGERERDLKKALVARFDLKEPPVEYLKTGHDWLNRKVRRVFKKGQPAVIGTIVGWLPEQGEDFALWHVKHIDGDSEDLEEHEVKKFLVEVAGAGGGGGAGAGTAGGKKRDAAAVVPAAAEALVVQPAPALTSRRPPRQAAAASAATEQGGNEADDEAADSDDDGPEPAFTDYWDNVDRKHRHLVPKQGDLGLGGLRKALTYSHNLVIEGIKGSARNNLYSREARKQLEQRLREAKTVVGLRSCLEELEEAVHSMQDKGDVCDADVVRAQMAKDRAADTKAGWLFTGGPKGDNAFIGKQARRYFPGVPPRSFNGVFDGKIVAFNPNEQIWRMVHDHDGDSEELDESAMLSAVNAFETDFSAEDLAAAAADKEEGGGVGDDQDIIDSDEEVYDDDQDGDLGAFNQERLHKIGVDDDEEDDEDEDDGYDAARKENELLWPAAEVRERWKTALGLAKTASEVALALSSFMAQAKVRFYPFSSFGEFVV
jgi:hypothetical protein